MVQLLKKQVIDVRDSADYYNQFYKDQNYVKREILNYLFRNITFVSHQDKIRALTKNEYEDFTKSTQIPIKLIHKFVSHFLVEIIKFRDFIQKNHQVFASNHRAKKVRIYMHKLYRIAPIFDYRRARENARVLRIKLNQIFFWPRLMTQICIVIFITDILDKNRPQKIIQSNLRTFCSCSAYAFHRTRNKLGLSSEYIKSL